MDIFEHLTNEHRTIGHVMDAFEAYAQSVRSGANDHRGLSSFTSFLKDYVDDLHHAAEETLLFATMSSNGFPLETGPVAVMLREHEEGRSTVTWLTIAASTSEPWSTADRERVARAIETFCSSLRAHINKEDRVLYPMAKERLTEPAKAAMNAHHARLLSTQHDARARLEIAARNLCGRMETSPQAAARA